MSHFSALRYHRFVNVLVTKITEVEDVGQMRST